MTLAFLVHLIASDNSISLLPSAEWTLPAEWDTLNRQVASLSRQEAGVFVCGEEEEAKQVMIKYELQAVKALLDAIFDGSRHFNGFTY